MEQLSNADPREVGPYRLAGRIGEGGMGQVYLGISDGGMRVAVKVMLAEHATDPEYRRRFRYEVEAAKRVGGLYTALVVDDDAEADVPWMATLYIEGPSLDASVSRNGPLDPRQVCELGAALAEGLASIHRRGLVHRDLKPSNVLLANDGPRIIDFGVAQADGMTRLTQAGVIVGTPAYMSPEQIDAGTVGPPSDVFSLGGILGYAATARSPFGIANLAAVSHAVLNKPPELGSLSGPLRDIIAACLAKDPAGRPGPAGLIAAFGALAESLPPLSAGYLTRPSPRPGRTVAKVTPTPSPRPDPPPVRARRLQRTRPPRPDRPGLQVKPTDDSWWLVAMDPACRWVAAGDGDGTVSVWDPGSARAIRSWPTGAPVRTLAASRDDWLATGGERGDVRVWDVRTGAFATSISLGGDVGVLALDWPGGLLVTGDDDQLLRVWDVTDPHEPVVLRRLRCPARPTALALDADGTQLAAGCADGRLRVWNLAQARTDEPLDTRQVQAGPVLAVAWDAAGERWLSTGADGFGPLRAAAVSPAGHGALADDGPGRVYVFPLDAPARLERMTGTNAALAGAAFAGRGLLVAGGTGGALHLWDARRQALHTALAPGRSITALAAAPDQARVAVCDDSPQITVWDLAHGTATLRWTRSCPKPATAAAFSPDGSQLATAGDAVRRWKTADGKQLDLLPDGAARARAVAFDPAGEHLAAAGVDGVVRVWQGRRLRHALTGHRGGVSSVALGADGQLMSAGSDDTVRTWDLAAGKEVACADDLGYRVRVLAALPAAGAYAAGCADGTVRLSQGPRWAGGARLDGHVQGVTSLCPDPTGRYLATAGLDGTARVWNLDTRSAELVIAVGPDGWAAATGRHDGNFRGHGPAEELIWQAFGLTRRPLPSVSGEDIHG